MNDWPSDYADQFWKYYPRRIAKKSAMKALEQVRKSNEVQFEKLIEAVKIYARAMSAKDVQYIAHPATWLNQGRWDDDPAALAGPEQSRISSAFDELIDRREAEEREDTGERPGLPVIRH